MRLRNSAAAHTERDATEDQHEAMAEKQPAHVGDLRTERHANAHLTRPLRRDISNHAVDADNAEQQRNTGRDGQHDHDERRLSHRIGLDLVQRPSGHERKIGAGSLVCRRDAIARRRPCRVIARPATIGLPIVSKKSSHHQARADQQHQRERELGDGQ